MVNAFSTTGNSSCILFVCRRGNSSYTLISDSNNFIKSQLIWPSQLRLVRVTCEFFGLPPNTSLSSMVCEKAKNNQKIFCQIWSLMKVLISIVVCWAINSKDPTYYKYDIHCWLKHVHHQQLFWHHGCCWLLLLKTVIVPIWDTTQYAHNY